MSCRLRVLCLCLAASLASSGAWAQAPAATSPQQPAAPSATPAAPATPKEATPAPAPAAPATPEPKAPAPSATPAPPTPAPAPTAPAPTPAPPAITTAPNAASPNSTPPKPLTPPGTPQTHEVEPGTSPQTPGTATMESIDVPARTIVFVGGQSSYDDAFASIKAALAKVKAAMDKAGLKPSGHPITIFTETSDTGFKYQAAVPIAAKPDGRSDLGDGVTIGMSPSGSGLKFRHRGPFDEIDSTYDLIVAYLDEKGLQVEAPYIEEYLADLTTADDPNLEVDIYTFVKK